MSIDARAVRYNGSSSYGNIYYIVYIFVYLYILHIAMIYLQMINLLSLRNRRYHSQVLICVPYQFHYHNFNVLYECLNMSQWKLVHVVIIEFNIPKFSNK